MDTTPTHLNASGGPALRAASRAAFLFYLLRGLVALGFGLFAVFAPRTTVHTFVFLFGLFCVIDGLIGLVASYVLRGAQWSWLTTTAVLGIVLGVVAMLWPATAVYAVMLLIALWALVVGAFQIKGSFDLRGRGDSGWYWTLIAGLVAVALGLLMLLKPSTTVATVVVLLGIFAIVYGVLQVVSALRVRKLPDRVLGN